jgi:hypothetical protein
VIVIVVVIVVVVVIDVEEAVVEMVASAELAFVISVFSVANVVLGFVLAIVTAST